MRTAWKRGIQAVEWGKIYTCAYIQGVTVMSEVNHGSVALYRAPIYMHEGLKVYDSESMSGDAYATTNKIMYVPPKAHKKWPDSPR